MWSCEGWLYTDVNANDDDNDDTNNDDTNDNDSDTQRTNHDCVGSLACIPNEPKSSPSIIFVAKHTSDDNLL